MGGGGDSPSKRHKPGREEDRGGRGGVGRSKEKEAGGDGLFSGLAFVVLLLPHPRQRPLSNFRSPCEMSSFFLIARPITLARLPFPTLLLFRPEEKLHTHPLSLSTTLCLSHTSHTSHTWPDHSGGGLRAVVLTSQTALIAG